MTELLTQFMPMFSVLWIAWYAKRRIEQCEARCARELERIVALLPPGDVPTEESVVVVEAEPAGVFPVEIPASLPVARALKA